MNQLAVDGSAAASTASPPTRTVFVTHEDEQGKTHVTFGDGFNGACLPTGMNNIVASYRVGAAPPAPARRARSTSAPAADPGLRSLRNPDCTDRRRRSRSAPDAFARSAPRSVLTFDRAISLDDYRQSRHRRRASSAGRRPTASIRLRSGPRLTVWVGRRCRRGGRAQTAIAADSRSQPRRCQFAGNRHRCLVGLTYVRDPPRSRRRRAGARSTRRCSILIPGCSA